MLTPPPLDGRSRFHWPIDSRSTTPIVSRCRARPAPQHVAAVNWGAGQSQLPLRENIPSKCRSPPGTASLASTGAPPPPGTSAPCPPVGGEADSRYLAVGPPWDPLQAEVSPSSQALAINDCERATSFLAPLPSSRSRPR